MADSTYYLWTNFTTDDGKKLQPGEKVTASTLGVDEAEFDAYVESGAVRTMKYPELPEGFTGSPREYALAQIAAAGKGEEYNVALAAAGGEPFVDPAAAAPVTPAKDSGK